jgi:alkylhydroperoxidase family enzyme
MSRVAPLDPPYDPKIQALFDLVMPEGMAPLELFRVLARSDRLFPRFMRAGVLDRGPVPIRDRELVIHRTTAVCRAEYEWGVHVTAFGRPLGFSDELLRATVEGDSTDPVFDARQSALIRLCDELHTDANISAEAWTQLEEHFDEMQILELIYTVGMYHSVSFLVNGLRLEGEPIGARFSDLCSNPTSV